MEILTSITFWIIVVAIIVILAIIGYVAEGTILANKKKAEEKPKQTTEDTTWTEAAPTEAELKQEKVYNTAEKSWLDMPNMDELPATPPEQPVPVLEPTMPEQPSPVLEPTIPEQSAPVLEPTMPEQSAPVLEPTMPEQPVQNVNNNQSIEKPKTTETQDIWTS